jgi:hypothetical protein
VRELDDLVGGDARLRRVHEALVAAGPPAELPPELATPPGRRERPAVRLMPRRRLGAALVLAAALALAGFGGGYLLGARGEEAFPTDFVLVMHGTDRAPNAAASLAVGELDEAGNWPMKMTVQGLPALAEGARYELLLTKSSELAVSCGTFAVDGRTLVFLNAPYRLRDYDGWVVTREGSREILLRTDEI